ncbi:Flp family type IVb pilin [Qipengyuania sp. NPDC077563]|uniref:Flp family type IVb pilin n=1 Tax=Qipengyuania sp. NPDC077563 TaxID=3364497 RepID=UPI00384D5126
MKFIKTLRKNEEGATAIEYGLIAALIAVAAMAAMGALGNNLNNTFDKVSGEMERANTETPAPDGDA